MAGREPPRLRTRRCEEAGMPVIGSRRALSCAMDQEGVTRRSEAEAGERMCRGTSAVVCMPVVAVDDATAPRLRERLVQVGRGWRMAGQTSCIERCVPTTTVCTCSSRESGVVRSASFQDNLATTSASQTGGIRGARAGSWSWSWSSRLGHAFVHQGRSQQ